MPSSARVHSSGLFIRSGMGPIACFRLFPFIRPFLHEILTLGGKEIYAAPCIACHQPDGKGLAAAFPPLDGSEWLTGDPSVPIRILLHGLAGPVKVAGQEVNSVMPPHADLDDRKVSEVITYVRQSWSNDAAPVSPEEVKVLREKHAA
jgi:mono/diheme cytochrome c family protein